MSCRLLTIPSSAMTSDQSNAVIALCSEVFELDYAYYMNLCPDRVHVLGYVDSQLVAHALWLDRPLRAGYGPWLNSAYVEGVATHADQRGRGYGAAVMRRLQAEAGRDCRLRPGRAFAGRARVVRQTRLGTLAGSAMDRAQRRAGGHAGRRDGVDLPHAAHAAA